MQFSKLVDSVRGNAMFRVGLDLVAQLPVENFGMSPLLIPSQVCLKVFMLLFHDPTTVAVDDPTKQGLVLLDFDAQNLEVATIRRSPCPF